MTALQQPHRITADEFLTWDPGDDARYELIDGIPVAQAAPSEAHGTLVVALGSELRSALRDRRPCRPVADAAIRSHIEGDETVRVADLAVTCAPPKGLPDVKTPVLVVEIVSPGNGPMRDRGKIAFYSAIPTIQEILLLHSTRRLAEIWRRGSDGIWPAGPETVSAGGILILRSVGAEIDLTSLYADTALDQRPQ